MFFVQFPNSHFLPPIKKGGGFWNTKLDQGFCGMFVRNLDLIYFNAKKPPPPPAYPLENGIWGVSGEVKVDLTLPFIIINP